jgi:predicted RNase H-like nuclease (RuvC/YqgF family)
LQSGKLKFPWQLVEQKRNILEAIIQETEATYQRHKEEAEESDNVAYKEHVTKLEDEIASLRKDQRRQSVSHDATVRNLQKRINNLKHESDRSASIQHPVTKHHHPPKSSSCTII